MTRFQQELSGLLDLEVARRKGTASDGFWERHAREQAADDVKRVSCDALAEEDGAIRWKSSGNYVPDEICERLEWAGYPFSRQATAAKREAQAAECIRAYRERMADHVPDPEETAELRAAFGEGTVVVDMFTGTMTVV